jgi:hypothetical protein
MQNKPEQVPIIPAKPGAMVFEKFEKPVGKIIMRTNRPAKNECGDCFYNDGSCHDDSKHCCYLLSDKNQLLNNDSSQHRSTKSE